MPGSKNKQVILVAEDDTMMNNMYKTKLENDGYEVEAAYNGAEALKAVREKKIDLVLLDIIMPQLDGFTVLKEMNADARLKKIPVIMLTNLGTDEDRKKGQEMGAVDYLVKANFTPDQVSEKIKKYI